MHEPVPSKLKADADIVFAGFWRRLCHWPANGERMPSRQLAPDETAEAEEPMRPPQDGLCYFHLN